MDSYEQADDFLYGDSFNYDDEPPELEDERDVATHVRRAAAGMAEAGRINSLFDAEVAKLEERRKAMLAPIAKNHAWHVRAVEGWHRQQLAAGNVGKTVKFPAGKSEIRANQPAMEIVDEDALRAWLHANDLEAVVYPVKEPVLSKKALNDVTNVAKRDGAEPGETLTVVNDDGEVVPGVRARMRAPRHQGMGEVKA